MAKPLSEKAAARYAIARLLEIPMARFGDLLTYESKLYGGPWDGVLVSIGFEDDEFIPSIATWECGICVPAIYRFKSVGVFEYVEPTDKT